MEQTYLLYMHVETQLGSDGIPWKSHNLQETMSQIHVSHVLTHSEQSRLSQVFERLDPGDSFVSEHPRRGVIDVCDVHEALAAKCVPPWTTLNLLQWLELCANIKTLHGKEALESVISWLEGGVAPLPWWVTEDPNRDRGCNRAAAGCNAARACALM